MEHNNRTYRKFLISPKKASWALSQFVLGLNEIESLNIKILLEESSIDSPYSDNISLDIIENSFNLKSDAYSSIDKILNKGDVLIVPALYPYLNSISFKVLCNKLRTKGVGIQVLVFDSQAISEMNEILDISNSVVIFDTQDLFQLVENGIKESNISLMPYLFTKTPIFKSENNISNKQETNNEFVVTIPDTGLTATEYNEIIQAAYLLSDLSSPGRLVLIRTPQNESHTNIDTSFPKDFLKTISLRGLESKISLIDSNVTLDSFYKQIKESNILVILGSSKSTLLERRGVASASISENTPIIRSSSFKISDIDNSSMFIDENSKDYLVKAIRKVFDNSALLNTIKEQKNKNINQLSYSTKYADLYITLQDKLVNENSKDLSIDLDCEEIKLESPKSIISLSKALPRILLKNRSNAFTHPGGDTVVMKRLLAGLENEGFDVKIDLEEKEDVRNYDLVHLFNFAIREVTEAHAKDCVSKNVPYVVTTLYEDWPVFYNQMAQMYIALDAYIRHGQPKDRWSELENAAKQVQSSAAWDNSFSANNAVCLIATGLNEENSLIRDYPSLKKVVSIPLGCEVSDYRDSGKLFREKFGVDNFILSVGRLEWRKNQLMLLKALEETDDTIVFAASGFTYQAEYAELCKMFKRKGRTIFLDRLSDLELASAYQAASMHVLPSWFELPGLVSLEAGRYGTPVVVSDTGSTRSYTGDFASYCNPDSADSIRCAVDEARNFTNKEEISNHYSQFTWNNSIKQHADLYNVVLSNLNERKEVVISEVQLETSPIVLSSEYVVEDKDLESESESYVQLCKDGDIALTSGKVEEARELFNRAVELDKTKPRAFRSLGATYYYQANIEKAEPLFAKALSIDPKDVKSILGKGAMLWEKGNKEDAYTLYKQASDMSPGDSSVILYMVNASYELNKLKELEKSLRNYLRLHPDNMSIQYCLAGCYFKQGNLSAASGVVERILTVASDNEQALELKNEIEKIIEEKEKLSFNQALESKTQDKENLVSDSNAMSNDSPKNTLISKIEFVNPVAGSDMINKSLSSGKSEILELESIKREKNYILVIEKANKFLSENKYEKDCEIRLLILKAEALACVGKIEESKMLFMKMLKDDLISPRVYSGLGSLEASSSNWNKAIEYFEKSLLDHPSIDVPLAGLGMCSHSLGNLEDSWNYYSESLRRNPINIHSILGLLDLSYNMKRLSEVEPFLRSYLDHKPVDLNIIYSLAGCLYGQGKTLDAIYELKNILAYEPEHLHARELLDKIEGDKDNFQEISVN